MQPSSNTNLQFLNLLTLLQTKQTLEDSKTYKEFCYQRYFLATHVELIDETYNINKTNPKYKSTYNRFFHTDALGSITSITDDKGTVVERRSYEAFGKNSQGIYISTVDLAG